MSNQTLNLSLTLTTNDLEVFHKSMSILVAFWLSSNLDIVLAKKRDG